MLLSGSWIFSNIQYLPVRKPPENGLYLETDTIYLEDSETRINLLQKQPHDKMSFKRWRLVKNQFALIFKIKRLLSRHEPVN